MERINKTYATILICLFLGCVGASLYRAGERSVINNARIHTSGEAVIIEYKGHIYIHNN